MSGPRQFDRLRRHAGSNNVRLADVARQVMVGERDPAALGPSIRAASATYRGRHRD